MHLGYNRNLTILSSTTPQTAIIHAQLRVDGQVRLEVRYTCTVFILWRADDGHTISDRSPLVREIRWLEAASITALGYFPPRGGRQKPRLNRGGIEGGPNANHRTGTSAHSVVHFGSLHHNEAAAIGKRPMARRASVGCAALRGKPSPVEMAGLRGGLRGGPLEVREIDRWWWCRGWDPSAVAGRFRTSGVSSRLL